MAQRYPKLRFGSARMLLLSSVTFIILSGLPTELGSHLDLTFVVEGQQPRHIIVSVVWTAEPRRCYWCGPLAEQVHRSRRAPACDAPDPHITVCDPGYHHCVIVATAPPYVESRYCVKLYQDECYPLFCNSTKTWRMTCPCRGDLCNGPNTDRELEAFGILTKLVAKSPYSRIKRTPKQNQRKAVVDDSNMALSSDNSEDSVNNNDIKMLDHMEESTTVPTTIEVTKMEEPTGKTSAEPLAVSTPEPIETPKINDDSTNSDHHDQTEDNSDENKLQEMQGDQPAIDQSKGIMSSEITNDVPNKEMTKDAVEVGMEKDNMEITTNVPKPEEPLDPLDMQRSKSDTIPAEPQHQDETSTEKSIVINMIANDIDEIISTTPAHIMIVSTVTTIESVKIDADAQTNDLSSKEMPNAESLQHDQAPTEKSITQAPAATTASATTVVTETTMAPTTENVMATLNAITTMKSKNNAISHPDLNTVFYTVLLIPIII